MVFIVMGNTADIAYGKDVRNIFVRADTVVNFCAQGKGKLSGTSESTFPLTL